MITTNKADTPYITSFSDGTYEAYSDAPIEKGGKGSGFGPHSLLEASLACCINIWLRMYAHAQGIPLAGVTAKVSLRRDSPGEARFQYAVELNGPLSEDQRERLLRQVELCPVSQTLSRSISFCQMKQDSVDPPDPRDM